MSKCFETQIGTIELGKSRGTSAQFMEGRRRLPASLNKRESLAGFPARLGVHVSGILQFTRITEILILSMLLGRRVSD